LGIISSFADSIYRLFVDHDVVGHTVIMSSLMGCVFLILVSVVTIVRAVLIRTGQEKVKASEGCGK
jgi:hypothetical protein